MPLNKNKLTVLLRLIWRPILVVVLFVGSCGWAIAATPKHHPHHKIIHKAGWAGAGFTAGRVVGPVGSATVGAAQYRRDLEAGGHRRNRAAVKIGGPIAAGVVAGPAGSVGYAAVEHRHWIKRHVLHLKPHRSR